MIKPDAFPNDAYGWLTNQCGHFLLGFAMVTVYQWVLFAVTGDYVTQWVTYVICVLFYFVVVELMAQKPEGKMLWDTAVDTAFVALGAAGWLLIDMAEVIHDLMLLMTILFSMLTPGYLRRLR